MVSQLLPVIEPARSPPPAAPPRGASVIGGAWSHEKFEQLLGVPGPFTSDGGCHVLGARAFADGSLEIDLQGGGLPRTTVCFWSRGASQAFLSTEGFSLGYKGDRAREPLFSLLRRASQRLQKATIQTLVKVVLMDPGKRVDTPQTDPVPVVTSPTSEERLHLVNTCNLKCRYCGEQTGPVVTMPEVERLLHGIHARYSGDLSRTRLLITGGEPTLSPILPDALQLARKLGFCDILMTTHGLRLADARYADTLAESGLSLVELSLRSFHEKNYDYITDTTGKFERALDGLRNSVTRFDVLANFVMNRHNYTEMLHTVQYLAELKATTPRRLTLMPSIVIIETITPRDAARWAEISVPNHILMPHLAEAVRWDHAQAPRIFVPEFGGTCYAPPCAGRHYPELLEHAPVRPGIMPVVYIEDPKVEDIPAGTRVKPHSCRTCRYDSVCSGVAPGNAALYGFSDLVPLT